MKKTFTVDGMHCKSCGMRIKESLGDAKGVNSTLVSHEEGKVIVDFDESTIDEAKVKDMISKEGFKVM